MPAFRIIILLTVINFFYSCPGLGQEYFTAPDTLCLNDSLIIENLYQGDASSYYWNFCSGNLSYDPTGENLGNLGDLLNPAFIDFAKEGTNYFAFISNHGNYPNEPGIVRYSYGSDLLSTPVSVNLGRFGKKIPTHLEGVQVVEDDGNWYVFVIGGIGEDSRLVRIDFGNSLANNPDPNDAVNLGNIGELDYPVDLYINYVDDSWIGFTVNQSSSTVTRFTFPNGLDNPPEGVNLGNPTGGGLNWPCGILPICEDDNWYIFISNKKGDNISRLDFEESLLNNPLGTSIGGEEYLDEPFDITIIRDCERTYGFVLNNYNDIVRLEFENGLGDMPTYNSLGVIGEFDNPHGISDIFRIGDDLYVFVANSGKSSTISRIRFDGCTNASPASSTEKNPPPVTYDQTGIYNINLVINEGTAEQINYCLDVVVLDSAFVTLGNDTIIPAGNSVILEVDSLYTAYEWSTGSTEESIEVFNAGLYYLTITNTWGCQASDDIEVILDIGIPNFFTPNGDGYNDTWSIPFFFNEPNADIQVFDRFGNMLIYYKSGEGEWDGTTRGRPVPVGTYWYVITVPDMDKPFKGSVSIKR